MQRIISSDEGIRQEELHGIRKMRKQRTSFKELDDLLYILVWENEPLIFLMFESS